MAAWLYKSALGTAMAQLMWKPTWWAALTTAEFLRGSVLSLTARSDLAQLTALPLDNI